MKESPLECNSYRPVNILSPFSKIIEKIWARQILEYMKKNRLIDENHQGGLPKRQSTTTVLDIFDRITKAKKEKNHCSIISMDQSGAFDMVCHEILKKKFKHIGFSEETIRI